MKQFLATLGIIIVMLVPNAHAWEGAAIKCDTAKDVRSILVSLKAGVGQHVFNKKLFAGKCAVVLGISQYTLGKSVPSLSLVLIGQKIRVVYRVNKIVTPKKFEGHYLIRQSVEPVISTTKA